METDKKTSPLEMGHPKEISHRKGCGGARGEAKGGGFKEDERNYDGKRNFNEVNNYVIPIEVVMCYTCVKVTLKRTQFLS